MNKLVKTLVSPDSLKVDVAYLDFVKSSRKQPKRLSHIDIKTTIFCFEKWSVNPFIKLSHSFLKEMTQVWLLQLYLPNLTGKRGIDSPNQTTDHVLITCPIHWALHGATRSDGFE